jgi:L-malate glycosyltransferase
MPKRVLIVSNMYPSASDPSYGGFVERCATALRDLGVETDVIGLGRREKLLARFLAYVGFGVRANIGIISKQYDCVYVHQPLHTLLVCLPALFIRRVRLALNFHGHDLVPVTKRGLLIQKLVAWKFRAADVVLVPSSHFKRIFDNRYGTAGIAPAHVFHSGGVEDVFFRPGKSSASSRGPTAIFLSRLVHGKGWRTFLEVARRLLTLHPDFRFTIAGIGPERAAVIAEIPDPTLKGCVTFEDSRSAEVNSSLLRTHRYFLFPTEFEESLALVNLEAMASGCVVLSSRFATATEYLEHGINGLLLPVDRYVDHCVDAIVQLENQPEVIDRLSSAAAATATNFRQANVMARLPRLLGVGD